MRPGRAILTFVLALLWLGMPVHCQIEAVSAAAILACIDDTDCASGEDAGCEDDFCDSIESANYFHHKAQVVSKVPVATALIPVPAEAPVFRPALADTSDSVPILHCGWQFIYRTAAPPRAPSFTA